MFKRITEEYIYFLFGVHAFEMSEEENTDEHFLLCTGLVYVASTCGSKPQATPLLHTSIYSSSVFIFVVLLSNYCIITTGPTFCRQAKG